jgi:hypothetical protein
MVDFDSRDVPNLKSGVQYAKSQIGTLHIDEEGIPIWVDVIEHVASKCTRAFRNERRLAIPHIGVIVLPRVAPVPWAPAMGGRIVDAKRYTSSLGVSVECLYDFS